LKAGLRRLPIIVDWIKHSSQKGVHKIIYERRQRHFHKGMTWSDYINKIPVELRMYHQVLAVNIVENRIRMTGREHVTGGAGAPVFSDGTVLLFSMRSWADLMAATWTRATGMEQSYLQFFKWRMSAADLQEMQPDQCFADQAHSLG